MASLVLQNVSTLLTKRWHPTKQAICWYAQKTVGGTKAPQNVPKGQPQKTPKTTANKTSPTVTPKKAAAPVTDIPTYKVPEYYEHNQFTFYDIDVQMEAKRLAQPSKFT